MKQHKVTELKWWFDATHEAWSDIHIPKVYFTVNADASESGWGAAYEVNPNGGIWSEHYKT